MQMKSLFFQFFRRLINFEQNLWLAEYKIFLYRRIYIVVIFYIINIFFKVAWSLENEKNGSVLSSNICIPFGYWKNYMYCQLFLFQSYVILLFRTLIANLMSTLVKSFNRIYRMCVNTYNALNTGRACSRIH